MKKILIAGLAASLLISTVFANQTTTSKNMPKYAPTYWQSKGPSDPYTISGDGSYPPLRVQITLAQESVSSVTILNCTDQQPKITVNRNSAKFCTLSTDASKPIIITADKESTTTFPTAMGTFEAK